MNPDMDVSNYHLSKIEDLSGPKFSFEDAFKEISKNPGMAFISFDPSESSSNSSTIVIFLVVAGHLPRKLLLEF
jgi:hypothetical protein